MRCYKKPFSQKLLKDGAIRWDYGMLPFDEREPPPFLYFVHVCGFRFVFRSLMQIAEYKAFYEQPLKPSFRVAYVTKNGCSMGGDHGEAQSAFARLPLYLWEKSKRPRVVAALSRAIRTFMKG